MTNRTFTICAIATLAAAATLALASNDPPPVPPVELPPAGPIALDPPKQPPDHRATDTSDRDEDLRALRAEQQLPTRALIPRRRAAHTTATRFLAGYLAHETGNPTPSSTLLVQRNASRRLAELVLADTPRVPPTLDTPPERGQLVDLTGEFDKPPTTYACRALVDRDGTVSELGLTMILRGGRWLVAALTE